MNESHWIKAAKCGDMMSLSALIDSNYQMIYRYLYKMTFDQMLSEDLTQETFTRFIQNLEKYTHDAKLSTYLITIAANLLKDHFKKSSSQKKLIEKITEKISNRPLHPTEADGLIIKEGLMTLDMESRSVLLLHEYYGYTLQEISQMLSIPVGTVKSKRHYALKKFKEDTAYE